ncbi:hypothetical protein BU24DRAFT_359196 [Aaosphaeria arxii CBS 175.79]|uniref:SMP-30/Gluconolactonase/LRE-like region domain-containing protein n=1 Tax=Aaosphaeria arxii CBS 175.79 TaxID=1450172 RepID=A0A6A5X7U4_9PLEO|nr:uncharacterized protein BU24DRAFT_359196 [Aaosphaeria arxii CBS 175.79]KAF2009105.1 hypothetical protein BU24DRAFT_359196 [Aaosphaeria arxii CBS 175.79]
MSEFRQWHAKEPFLNIHCLLGEGPYYEKATHSLRFVDIVKKQLHTVSLAHGPGSLVSIQLNEAVCATADIENEDPAEKILVALKYGIAVLNRQTANYEYLGLSGSKDPRVRSNDGAVDPNGNFWVGTMTDFGMGEFRAEGSLFRHHGTSAQRMLSGLTIPNSVRWSADGKTMYFTHTTTRQICAFDFSTLESSISNQRVLYHHKGPGVPDGFCLDVKGNIWHAIYGEGRVLRINPGGVVTGEIKVPTNNVTSVEFAGTSLFITTAEDIEGSSRSKDLSGALFQVDVGICGLGHHLFKMKPSNSHD